MLLQKGKEKKEIWKVVMLGNFGMLTENFEKGKCNKGIKKIKTRI